MADCTCNNFPEGLGNVTFGAKVGIGTMSPIGKLQVNGPTIVGNPTSTEDPAAGTGVVVNVAMPAIAGEFGMVDVYASNDPAVGVGGSINLGGRFRSGTGNDYASFAKILGAKEAGGQNYSGYLAFYTRAHGAGHIEAMRITSARKVGIGTTAPGEKLEVNGNVKAVGNAILDNAGLDSPGFVVRSKNTTGQTIDGVPNGQYFPDWYMDHYTSQADPSVYSRLRFIRGDTEMMTLDPQGNLRINNVLAIRQDGIANKAYYSD